MNTQTKFIRCSPHLPVKNLRQTLDYYRDVLGFTGEWVFGDKDGGIARDDLRMLFAEDPDFTNDLNSFSHRLPLMWFVSNIERIFEEFLSRNITIEDQLRDYTHGLREFAFIDLNGYYIRVAEPLDNFLDN
jgi:catechol 2,3-dioxygenase-like lactoylglutathione lyase family enzyme